MFTKKNQNANPALDEVIDELLLDMKTIVPNTEAYAKSVAHLSALMKLKESNTPERISADTKAIILANLAGILVIVSYEHAHVVTSKALSFVQKLR